MPAQLGSPRSPGKVPDLTQVTTRPACSRPPKLTLIHDRLEASPKTAASVRGWSYILSNLKTVVETGEALPPLM